MLKIGSLCTGYGGLDWAVQQLFGGQLIWVADNNPGAAAILAHHHPDIVNLGDITQIKWVDLDPVDILVAGFPCQDISNAGRRAGILKGNRSGIWFHIVEAIDILRPQLIILENVASIRTRGLDIVLAELARLGFDAQWTCVRASDIGAPHHRRRWFLVAYPAHLRHQRGRQAWRRWLGSAHGHSQSLSAWIKELTTRA